MINSIQKLLSGQNNDSKMFMFTSGSYKFQMINIRIYEICTAEFWALWGEKIQNQNKIDTNKTFKENNIPIKTYLLPRQTIMNLDLKFAEINVLTVCSKLQFNPFCPIRKQQTPSDNWPCVGLSGPKWETFFLVRNRF